MKKYIVAITSLLIVCCSKDIIAQSKGDTIFITPKTNTHYDSLVNLDAIVISSNQMPVNKRNAPSLINLVDQRIIQATQNICASDILSYQSGVRVENNCSSCGYKQARINGLSGYYTELMIDSRAVLSSISRLYGLEQLPANMIDRVEVMRGGGSALYGSSAVGGVINIITKQAKENSAQINHSLTSIGMSSSLDNVTSFNSTLISEDKNKGISFFAQNRQRDGYSYYDDGMTTMPKLNVLSLGTKMFFYPTQFSKIDILYNLMQDERRGGNKLSMPVEQSNVAEQNNHAVHNLNINYIYNSEDNRYHLNLFSSFSSVNRKSYVGGYGWDYQPDTNAWRYHTQTKDITFNIGALFRYGFEKLIFLPAHLTIGTQYTGDYLKDKALGYDITNKQDTRVASLYAQNEWSDNKWNILIGVRLDKHNLIDNIIPSARLNVKYSLKSDWDLRFSYSEGFRAPQVYDEDLHVMLSGGERYLLHLAKDLKEERSRSLSLSLDYYCSIKQTKVNFMLEGFATFLQDVFADRVLEDKDALGNTIIERYNSQGAKYYGIGAEIKTVFSSYWQTDIGFTAQKSLYNNKQSWSEDVKPSRQILHTPNYYGYLTMEYSPNSAWDFDLTATYSGRMYVAHFVGSATNVDKVEHVRDFLDMNLKIKYSFSFIQTTRMELSLMIINIFNQYQKDLDKGINRDSEYVYGPAMPRSLSCCIGIKF